MQFLIEKMLEVQQLLQKKGGCSGCSKSVKQYKGSGRSGGQKIDKRKIRGNVVKKLMAQGMTFGQASKEATNYIKQHNLY